MTRYGLPVILVLLLVALGYMNSDLIARLWPQMASGWAADGWNTLLALSLVANVVLVAFGVAILKWRSSVGDGMMAVVPSELLSLAKDVTQRVDGSERNSEGHLKKLLTAFDETRKHVPSIAQSIEILKRTLDEKDRELAALRSGNTSDQHVLLAKKAIKLYQMMQALKASIARGQASEGTALEFLSEELSAVFDDLGVQIFKPMPGDPLASIPADFVSVKETVPATEQRLHNTIATVREPGFGFKLPGNKLQMIRPAIVAVNIFGGANGDHRN